VYFCLPLIVHFCLPLPMYFCLPLGVYFSLPFPPGLIFHADRGSQYASHKVKKILKAWHIHQSMSNEGNCFNNAMMESFFSSLKKEFVHLMTFHSKDQARRDIFRYIEIFYNRQRKHSDLNQKNPFEYYQDATQTF